MYNPIQKPLDELNKSFLDYCTKVEENVQLAVKSFLNTDIDHVQGVMDNDDLIDQMLNIFDMIWIIPRFIWMFL